MKIEGETELVASGEKVGTGVEVGDDIVWGLGDEGGEEDRW